MLSFTRHLVQRARRIENPYLRATEFVEVLGRVAVTDRPAVQIEALKAAAQVANLGMRLRIIREIDANLDSVPTLEAVVGIAPASPHSASEHERWRKILEAIRNTLRSDEWRAVVRTVWPRIPDELQSQIVYCASGISSMADRVRCVGDILDLLPERMRTNVWPELLEGARMARNPSDALDALLLIAPQLAEPLRSSAYAQAIEVAFESAESLESVVRGETIQSLARSSPREFALRGMERLKQIPPSDSWSLAFDVALESLSRAESAREINVKQVARSYAGSERRARALKAVLEKEDDLTASRVVAEFESFDRDYWRYWGLVSAVTQKRRTEQLATDVIVDDLENEPDPFLRATWLSRIARYSQRPANVGPKILKALDEIPNQRLRAELSSHIASLRLPNLHRGLNKLALELGDSSVRDATVEAIKKAYEPPPIAGKNPVRLGLSIPPRTPVVNVGFATPEPLFTLLGRETSLECNKKYYFVFEVSHSDARRWALDKRPHSLPAGFEGAELRVAVISVDGISIVPGADTGTVRVNDDMSATVLQQPGSVVDSSQIPFDALFFPVNIAHEPGIYHLRCNVYYEHVLVQSRLVTARALLKPVPMQGALQSQVDYSLARVIDLSLLKRLTPHQASLMLSAEDDRNITFSFFAKNGDEVIKRDASYDVLEIADSIEKARGALRRVAWGDDGLWESRKRYRYERPIEPAQLRDDLITLALEGYRLYDVLVDRLTRSRDDAKGIAAIMREPGLVQIAIKETPRHLIPTAIFYDLPLDTGLSRERYALCRDYLEGMQGGAALEACRCFNGACITAARSNGDNVICPGGFWGFRHALSFPVSLPYGMDSVTEIASTGKPRFIVGVSTDPEFTLREQHQSTLKSLVPSENWKLGSDRRAILDLLKANDTEFVYFYCHGGVYEGTAFIQVGSVSEVAITRENLRNENICWHNSTPLVMINGCRTAEVDPSRAVEFVSAFLRSNAAGVIGSEITLFEPLACSFAEEFFRHFVEGATVAKAVRDSRLALLKRGNPLGLAYIPFCLGSLQIKC